MRCFIAIEIPRPIQDQLFEIQGVLRKQVQRASWVKPGNIHLTLKFLGDVNPIGIDSIRAAVKPIVASHGTFSMSIGGIGVFPDLARPRVIWAGIRDGSRKVSHLAQDINRVLSRCGFPFDTKFNSHLTIARLRGRADLKPVVELFRQYDEIPQATMLVQKIQLIHSQLHPRGSIYTTLQSYPLTAPSQPKQGD